MSMEDRKYFLIPEGTRSHSEWKAHCEECARKKALWIAWAKTFGAESVVVNSTWERTDVVGLPANTAGLDMKLWRFVRPRRGENFFTPRRVGKDAKALSEQMHNLHVSGWRPNGVVATHISGLSLHYTTWENRNGKLIVSCHKNAKAEIPDAVPLKLSEYAAIVERAEEAKKQEPHP